MDSDSNKTSTMISTYMCSEEIVGAVELTKDALDEESDPNSNSTVTGNGTSTSCEKTVIPIRDTLSTTTVQLEATETDRIECIKSVYSQNILPINHIDVIEEDKNNDAKEKNQATVIDTESSKVKIIGSLGLLSQYSSSSDETNDTEDEDSESGGNEISQGSSKIQNDAGSLAKIILDKALSKEGYRIGNIDTSESDADDSDIEYITDKRMHTIDMTIDDDLHEFLENCENNKGPQGPIRAKGEFRVEDLPPIEELSITVAESDCVQLGTVNSVVDTLVLVESLPNFAALDIDTVLFLEAGNRTLGQVFDVMGNVASPIYCVRFNSADDIRTKNLLTGMKVYVAPQTEYTNFIVLSELMNQKGCDASWENDHEVPQDCNEFSDDEEERLARRTKAQKQRNRNRTSETDVQLSDKMQIKSEPFASNTSHRKNWPRGKASNSTRFYKDNREYNNRCATFNQHEVSPNEYNHSWHTAAPRGVIQPPAGMPPPMQQGAHPQPDSIYYPNPFALQMSYNQFNHEGFPPLPPTMHYKPLHQPKK